MILVGKALQGVPLEKAFLNENQDGGRVRASRKQPNYKKATPISYAGEPKPRIPAQKKLEIIARMRLGHSKCKIAREMIISKSSVSNIMQHFNKYGNVQDLPRSGRPRKISPRAAAEMRQAIKNHRLQTTADCKKWLSKNYHVKVSPKTLRNTLKTRRCRDYIKQSKPALSEEGALYRVACAKEWRHWSEDEVNAIVFSDEKSFGQDLHGQKEHVWLCAPAPFDGHRMIAAHPFGGVHVKLWAAITNSGFLAYEFFDQQLDSRAYVRILRKKLLPKALAHYGPRARWSFQQENAQWQTGDDVTDLLEAKRVKIIYWPPNSPDLNLIENVWPEMNRRISQLPHDTKQKLKDAIEAVIMKMNEEEPSSHYFKHLYQSFPHRVEQVLKSGGLPINY